MKVISLICQKGGTAKTTTAINLAVEAFAYGLEVVIIDLDPQVSACDWKDIRGDAPPVVAATPVPHLERTLKAAGDNGALIDLKTLGATLDIIRLAGNKPTRALLARVKSTGTRHEDTAAWLVQQGIEVCPAMMGERVTYQDAYAQGLGVSEADPAGKAALEIKSVYLYISSLLGLPTRRVTNEEVRSARQRVA
jgi:chromosome partitioning protein